VSYYLEILLAGHDADEDSGPILSTRKRFIGPFPSASARMLFQAFWNRRLRLCNASGSVDLILCDELPEGLDAVLPRDFDIIEKCEA